METDGKLQGVSTFSADRGPSIRGFLDTSPTPASCYTHGSREATRPATAVLGRSLGLETERFGSISVS